MANSFEKPPELDPEEEPITRNIEEEEEIEKENSKLERIMESISEGLRAEGIPLEEDCRISKEAFGKVYSKEEIERDREYTERHQEKWKGEKERRKHKRFTLPEYKKEKMKESGERLEILKTAVFDKFLGDSFITVRSSSFDDIRNNIDNIILEKETGNLVCAFDEVADILGERYQQKAKEVLQRNKEGGRLKYGLKIEKDKEGKNNVVLGGVENIPIFYLALPPSHIKEGIENLVSSQRKKSAYEEKLFRYFLGNFNAQIRVLKLEKNLNPTLKKRIKNFERILEKLS